MPEVFVGYASEDQVPVQRLVEELERAGWSVWWDKTDISSGAIRTQIEQAISAASCAIVVWSSHSISKPWVIDEATRVRNLDKPLLPVRIEQVDIPFGFGDLHTFDLHQWVGSSQDPEIRRLERCLDEIASETASLSVGRRSVASQAFGRSSRESSDDRVGETIPEGHQAFAPEACPRAIRRTGGGSGRRRSIHPQLPRRDC